MESETRLPIILLVEDSADDYDATMRSFKKAPTLRRIPIIILTTSSDSRDVTQCYELGASTYIQKPVEFDGLLTAVACIKDYWLGIALLPGESVWNRP